MGLTISQGKAVTVIKARAYARASRPEKARILDEPVELKGWNRTMRATGFAAPSGQTGAAGQVPHQAPIAAESPDPGEDLGGLDDAAPGFVEIDLVGHEGGVASGQFCFTLTVTDISTGWTVNRSATNKAQKWVFAALQYALGRFPIPILGIDSDNVSEFINDYLLACCHARQITSTWSGNKNDGAHVEQKNWGRVRELVGYCRYDTAAELEKLNAIWELDALLTNYLLPQQKLVSKLRHGAKMVKEHDAALTPHQRAAGIRTSGSGRSSP